MTYYNLSREVTLIGHLGFHKAAGNERTELSPENGKPINQISWAYGVGIDWNFYQNMGLYLRQLWMGHKDKNFILDKFRGWETTFEIKVFF
jgi:opacity protein-like surface antigen